MTRVQPRLKQASLHSGSSSVAIAISSLLSGVIRMEKVKELFDLPEAMSKGASTALVAG